VRTALQDAASVAGILITTEAAVADAPTTAVAAWAAWATWTSKKSGHSRLTKTERAGPATGPPFLLPLLQPPGEVGQVRAGGTA